ncbi:MAG TPA: N-acetylmuramoyl-L-alanine amidase [Gemmatimonadales bacterium]|nr:N-acetylmuramoyl-L-alanine amidase [Gemmatimonadales bacterium]
MAVHVDRRYRLPQSEYFAQSYGKSGIAIHHTVSDAAERTLAIWERDRTMAGTPRRVGTAYVIDLDGTIFEAFDPACWAWQFGLSWPETERLRFERRFIGIELVSEGGLTEHQGRLYAYGLLSRYFELQPDEAFDAGTPYRGYRWFGRYERAQLVSLGRLVDELCGRFSIPRVYPEQPYLYYGDALRSFNGVIGHAMVRSDKSDPAPDPRLWATLEQVGGLKPVPLTAPASVVDVEALFAGNARRLDRLNVAAGSLVKALLMELQRRDVHVKLKTPLPGTHTIEYDVVRGDRAEVARLGRALGFTRVTERELEVRHA